jgi:nucleoid-associated protein YgaU
VRDHYANLQYGAGALRERATRQVDEMESAENAGDEEPVNAAAEPLNDRGQADSYVVEPHDNFWRISQKVYGTGAYYKALEEYNRRQSGERKLVNAGDVLSVPSIDVLRDKYPDLCPKPRTVASQEAASSPDRSPRTSGRRPRTYTVVEGDTLFDIARRELGKATRWAEIYRLNRDQLGEDFNNLAPGMELLLPAEVSRPAPMASRPQRDDYRR